jgi:hypothetical protein
MRVGSMAGEAMPRSQAKRPRGLAHLAGSAFSCNGCPRGDEAERSRAGSLTVRMSRRLLWIAPTGGAA